MIRERIKKVIASKDIKQNEIARQCGIEKGHFSRFLSGQVEISINRLEKVFKYLDIKLN